MFLSSKVCLPITCRSQGAFSSPHQTRGASDFVGRSKRIASPTTHTSGSCGPDTRACVRWRSSVSSVQYQQGGSDSLNFLLCRTSIPILDPLCIHGPPLVDCVRRASPTQHQQAGRGYSVPLARVIRVCCLPDFLLIQPEQV